MADKATAHCPAMGCLRLMFSSVSIAICHQALNLPAPTSLLMFLSWTPKVRMIVLLAMSAIDTSACPPSGRVEHRCNGSGCILTVNSVPPSAPDALDDRIVKQLNHVTRRVVTGKSTMRLKHEANGLQLVRRGFMKPVGASPVRLRLSAHPTKGRSKQHKSGMKRSV